MVPSGPALFPVMKNSSRSSDDDAHLTSVRTGGKAGDAVKPRRVGRYELHEILQPIVRTLGIECPALPCGAAGSRAEVVPGTARSSTHTECDRVQKVALDHSRIPPSSSSSSHPSPPNRSAQGTPALSLPVRVEPTVEDPTMSCPVATVRAATSVESGEPFAIKARPQKLLHTDYELAVEFDDAVGTLVNLKSHPNLISYVETFITSKNSYVVWRLSGHMTLLDLSMFHRIAEGWPGARGPSGADDIPGTLSTSHHVPHLTEATVARLFGHVVSGVAHLHAQGIAHTALALEHCFLDNTGTVAVGCLDHIHEVLENQETRIPSRRSTHAVYMPPEILVNKVSSSSAAAVAACGTANMVHVPHPYAFDIWGLGVILYALLHGGEMPYQSSREVYMRDPTLKPRLSHAARDLLLGMLTADVHERLSLTAIRAHPWFETMAAALAAHRSVSGVNSPVTSSRWGGGRTTMGSPSAWVPTSGSSVTPMTPLPLNHSSSFGGVFPFLNSATSTGWASSRGGAQYGVTPRGAGAAWDTASNHTASTMGRTLRGTLGGNRCGSPSLVAQQQQQQDPTWAAFLQWAGGIAHGSTPSSAAAARDATPALSTSPHLVGSSFLKPVPLASHLSKRTDRGGDVALTSSGLHAVTEGAAGVGIHPPPMRRGDVPMKEMVVVTVIGVVPKRLEVDPFASVLTRLPIRPLNALEAERRPVSVEVRVEPGMVGSAQSQRDDAGKEKTKSAEKQETRKGGEGSAFDTLPCAHDTLPEQDPNAHTHGEDTTLSRCPPSLPDSPHRAGTRTPISSTLPTDVNATRSQVAHTCTNPQKPVPPSLALKRSVLSFPRSCVETREVLDRRYLYETSGESREGTDSAESSQAVGGGTARATMPTRGELTAAAPTSITSVSDGVLVNLEHLEHPKTVPALQCLQRGSVPLSLTGVDKWKRPTLSLDHSPGLLHHRVAHDGTGRGGQVQWHLNHPSEANVRTDKDPRSSCGLAGGLSFKTESPCCAVETVQSTSQLLRDDLPVLPLSDSSPLQEFPYRRSLEFTDAAEGVKDEALMDAPLKHEPLPMQWPSCEGTGQSPVRGEALCLSSQNISPELLPRENEKHREKNSSNNRSSRARLAKWDPELGKRDGDSFQHSSSSPMSFLNTFSRAPVSQCCVTCGAPINWRRRMEYLESRCPEAKSVPETDETEDDVLSRNIRTLVYERLDTAVQKVLS